MSTNGIPRNVNLLQRLISLLLRERQREADDPRARSWAREAKSLSDVPETYAPFFDRLPPNQREPFPYTVLTPTFKGGRARPETERLLCIVEGAVHVLESVDGRLRATRYSPYGVSFIERGSILLHAWITIHGEDQDGALCSTKLRFSSVTDFLMAPFVESLRPAVVAATEADVEAQRSRFNYLAPTHFKFMSYGRSCIRPGETALEILLQPQIRRELVNLFGFSLSRLVSAAHLTILANSELILIRDDESQRWVKGSSHGAIWTYIPRAKILDVVLTSTDDGSQVLTIIVAGGLRIQSLFEAGKGRALERILDHLRS